MDKTVTDVQASLQPLAEGLRADGYELEVLDATDSGLQLRVIALAGACEECLVPKDAMVQVVSASLGRRYGADEISVQYPASAVH